MSSSEAAVAHIRIDFGALGRQVVALTAVAPARRVFRYHCAAVVAVVPFLVARPADNLSIRNQIDLKHEFAAV